MNRPSPFVNREELKSGKEAFFARIRKALARPEGQGFVPFEEGPTRNEAVIRQVAGDDPGLVERFMEGAKRNSMMVRRVGVDGVKGAVEEILGEAGTVARCMVNVRDVKLPFEWGDYLRGKGVEMVKWGEAGCREAAFGCEVSITDCRAGLADTGSVMVWSEAGFGRSSTLVIPVHVVLVAESRILADLVDGMELVRQQNPEQLPSNVVVINGPSKTADIEMNLITGVHGPKFVHVVVIEGM